MAESYRERVARRLYEQAQVEYAGLEINPFATAWKHQKTVVKERFYRFADVVIETADDAR